MDIATNRRTPPPPLSTDLSGILLSDRNNQALKNYQN